jgi:NADH-quinone oxidoreductase subunit G
MMALILIDGKEISVKQGETILQAALRESVYIPYFCFHPSLSIVGQCRMCLVKVEGVPKLLTACTTTVEVLPQDKKIDGKYDMKVITASDEVKEAQRGIMEFLLTNHPLDCPICDQAGECQLQEYSYTYGAPRSEFDFEKLHAPKRVAFGPHIVYDAERCIKCTRCIRFCGEIAKTNELTLIERGAHTIVGTFNGKPLDNPYSVCTSDICPVGALTYKEFRFKERVWFLQAANSICPECARNCSIRVDTYKGEILRLVPRFNPNVNGYYMCDHGRLISERIKDREVRESPSIRKDGRLQPVQEAVFCSELLKVLSEKKYQAKDVAVILSGRMSLEEMSAYKVFSREMFGEVLGEVLFIAGDKDDILVHEEKRPNYCGAKFMGLPLTKQISKISENLKGKKALIVIREDLLGDAETAECEALTKMIGTMETVVVMDAFFTRTAALAGFYAPLAGWFEMEGTTVNFQGRLQKIAKCITPPRQRRPFYDVVSELMKASGKESPKGFLPWFEEVKKDMAMIEYIKIKEIVPLGVTLPGVKHGTA